MGEHKKNLDSLGSMENVILLTKDYEGALAYYQQALRA